MLQKEDQMSTLSYYENHRTLSQRIALLEAQLQFRDADVHSLESELLRCKEEQRQIEDSLAHYIPYPLAARPYYKALEEQEFLFYRCIKGLTMRKTAELMCISRDTAYRIRRRIAESEGRFASFGDKD